MKKHMFYIIALFLVSSFSAHAMKMKKFDKNIFKTNHVSKIVNNKLFKHDALKYIKTVHALDKHTQKQLFHTTLPIIHNDDFKVKTIKLVNDEESNNKKENILIKIKEKPQEFIKNFMKIKTLRETSEKNVYLNGIGQKLFYNPENKQFYFDPREVKIQTNGPILGCIGYFGVKAIAYGTIIAGLGTLTVATGGVAGGASAVAISSVGGTAAGVAAASGAGTVIAGAAAPIIAAGTGAAVTSATIIGAATGGTTVVATAIVGAGGAGTAAAVSGAVMSSAGGAAATVGMIESVATTVGAWLAAVPWL